MATPTQQQSTMATPTMKVALHTEQTQLAAAAAHSLQVLVSMAAPEAPPSQRQPLELCAVVDRSGSMSGSKMTAMKEALRFLVSHGLQSDDRFALVAFDNNVEVRLPVTSMDAKGKKAGLEMVDALDTGGTTNLSGGLLRGLDLLGQSTNANTNKAVMIFTDGIANNGITDPAGILAAAQGAMAGSPTTLFTFGFGADHTESLLRSLAEDTNGLYYYVQKSEDIPVSFADCLGGLVSVVAQNATLTIEGVEGTAVAKVHCNYKQEAATDGSGVLALALGDIYAEDEKDVLISCTLPALGAPRTALAPALRVSLRYFSVGASMMESVSAELALGRPEQTPAGQPVPARLDEQRNRVAVAEAMAAASELADSGKIEEGRSLLLQAVAVASASPAAASKVVSSIIRDATAAEAGYADAATYRAIGSKMSKMSAMSHMQQRSTHCSAAMYERKSKVAMKASFLSSSASNAVLSSASSFAGEPTSQPPAAAASSRPATVPEEPSSSRLSFSSRASPMKSKKTRPSPVQQLAQPPAGKADGAAAKGVAWLKQMMAGPTPMDLE